MSGPLTSAEQVLVAAAQVAATTFADMDREKRALAMVSEVLPDLPCDEVRPTGVMRFHAEAMIASVGKPREYEAARHYLRAALVDFFEMRAASALTRWRDEQP